MDQAARNETVVAGDSDPGIVPGASEFQRAWVKVAVALVLAGQGMAFGLAANMTPPEGNAYYLLHGGLFLSSVAVFVLLGGPLVRETIRALRGGRITVDLLFLITLSGAFVVSVFSTIQREGPVFYELVAVLLAIYTVGKLLGARSRARALQAVEGLRTRYDHCVLRSSDGSSRKVSAAEVQPGDKVLVAIGEPAAIDGIIRSGMGLVLTTPLTGEPDPVVCGPGDRLLAGMQSIDGSFVVEVENAVGSRRIDAMLTEIESARLKPSRLQTRADRLASRFVPLVVAVSIGTFLFWMFRAGLSAAIVNSLAVLVVACPCALGLATPLGVWAGLARIGQLGVVARTGDFLESLAGADVVFFDKTGTLCEPELKVARMTVLETSPMPLEKLRAALSVAEAGIDHPVAAALRQEKDGGSVFELVEARTVPGRGIRAVLRESAGGNNHELLAGSEQLIIDAGINRPPDSDANPRSGLRRIVVAIDGQAAAEVLLDENPRERAGEWFHELAKLGFSVEILTGDAAFSSDVWPDVPRQTGLRPEDKASIIRERQAAGSRVVFVGDGLNDGPALATADASVALRQGSDLARSNAMAVVAGERLGTLSQAVKFSRETIHAIESNLRFAAAYNTIGMGIAAAGWLHPILAALLMAGSSFFVSARVLRAGS